MLTRAALALLVPVALLSAGSLASADDSRPVDYAKEREAIAEFQALDQRLQDVGWKLARGNAGFCPEAIPSVGLQLQDVATYGQPEIARAALGLEGDFALQTAAKGSPAGAHPGFLPNREIRHVGGIDPNSLEAGDRLDWRRLKAVHDAIDQSLAHNDEFVVVFADGEQAKLQPVPACATRFELAGSGGRAIADGERVQIGVEFPGFAMTEDLFAAAVAHELAHNLLGHRKWLDSVGRGKRNVRETEREADRLMPWLLANAGYEPEAAVQFFEAYKPSSGSVLFIPGSHAKWRDRAKTVQAEVMVIKLLILAGENANWPKHFIRDIARESGD